MAKEHPKFDDDVPQFSGKINETFMDWVTEVRLWEAKHRGRDETSPWATLQQEWARWTGEADRQEAWARRPRKFYSGQHRSDSQRQRLQGNF